MTPITQVLTKKEPLVYSLNMNPLLLFMPSHQVQGRHIQFSLLAAGNFLLPCCPVLDKVIWLLQLKLSLCEAVWVSNYIFSHLFLIKYHTSLSHSNFLLIKIEFLRSALWVPRNDLVIFLNYYGMVTKQFNWSSTWLVLSQLTYWQMKGWATNNSQLRRRRGVVIPSVGTLPLSADRGRTFLACILRPVSTKNKTTWWCMAIYCTRYDKIYFYTKPQWPSTNTIFTSLYNQEQTVYYIKKYTEFDWEIMVEEMLNDDDKNRKVERGKNI